MVLVSHVDDLLVGGPEEQLRKLRARLAGIYEVKGNTIKEGSGTLKFLVRTKSLGDMCGREMPSTARTS